MNLLSAWSLLLRKDHRDDDEDDNIKLRMRRLYPEEIISLIWHWWRYKTTEFSRNKRQGGKKKVRNSDFSKVYFKVWFWDNNHTIDYIVTNEVWFGNTRWTNRNRTRWPFYDVIAFCAFSSFCANELTVTVTRTTKTILPVSRGKSSGGFNHNTSCV